MFHPLARVFPPRLQVDQSPPRRLAYPITMVTGTMVVRVPP